METATLADVMYSTAGLSYFMEFMDRQNLMRLVQFWIVVDGFRNPLEDDNDENPTHSSSAQTWTPADRADLAQINDAYLSKPEINTSPVDLEDVKIFLRAGKAATGAQYHAARRAVLRTQTAAYEKMLDPYFINFKKSNMWFKFLDTEEANAAPPLTPSHAEPPHNGHTSPTMSRPKASRSLNSKAPDLRRAVASSADLKGVAKQTDEGDRRSFDSGSNSSRQPLFDDDLDTDPLAKSTASFDSDPDTNGGGVVVQDPRVVDAMQAALHDIMEEKPEGDSLFSDDIIRSPQDEGSMHGSMELPRPNSLRDIKDNPPRPSSSGDRKDRQKPSIASLGLVHGVGRQGVFDDDLFGEETRFAEDDKEDDHTDRADEDEIHEAAPGDLGLAEAIDTLTLDIEKLVTQESIVDSLYKKAELTNNAAELRILRKSKASLQREINRKELQRQQYIIQESDNSLYGRAKISIKSIMVGTEEDGKEFAMCKFSRIDLENIMAPNLTIA
jgi:sorting nexin-25